MPDREDVVLLDEQGRAIGAVEKAGVHHASTPLHLAFSCYVFDTEERLLVTRRALSKTTFPGVWTNSVCGHPAPSEGIESAARRRVRQEIGLDLADVRLVLPDFRYTATMNGIVENEICPVVIASAVGDVRLNRAEVESAQWLPWQRFSREVLDGTRAVSTWCRLQVKALHAIGPSPSTWGTAEDHRLPPAARVA
jgi:isopentenyl-diphosphate delta-isomerase